MSKSTGTHPAVGVGWTGASGLAYGVRLAEVLPGAGRDVNLVASGAVSQTEFTAPLASGSAHGGP